MVAAGADTPAEFAEDSPTVGAQQDKAQAQGKHPAEVPGTLNRGDTSAEAGVAGPALQLNNFDVGACTWQGSVLYLTKQAVQMPLLQLQTTVSCASFHHVVLWLKSLQLVLNTTPVFLPRLDSLLKALGALPCRTSYKVAVCLLYVTCLFLYDSAIARPSLWLVVHRVLAHTHDTSQTNGMYAGRASRSRAAYPVITAVWLVLLALQHISQSAAAAARSVLHPQRGSFWP